jgi:haloacetate dehalogenase
MAFAGFDARRIAVGEVELFVRVGGSGAPLLLLHGYPQTHMIWHAVAPLLADRFQLVIPDLRGYGRSSAPPPDDRHLAYSKRTMAADMLALMSSLGHTRFAVAGHDRGGRVAYRMALDAPERVTRLAVLDIVPTYEMWRRMGQAGALRSYHWSFLAQPAPMPERLIGADPDFYLEHLLRRWTGDFSALTDEALQDYREAFRKPSVIAATCADYRAGASVDIEHDRADVEAGRRIACPTRVIWARQYLSSQSPLATWQSWCTHVDDVALDCGHFIAEEKPAQCANALRECLSP